LIAEVRAVGGAYPVDPGRRRDRRGSRRRGQTRGADILFGIGGTPEGVIAAAAMKCMGGRDPGAAFWPRKRGRGAPPAIAAGYDPQAAVLTTDDLVQGDKLLLRPSPASTDGRGVEGRALRRPAARRRSHS